MTRSDTACMGENDYTTNEGLAYMDVSFILINHARFAPWITSYIRKKTICGRGPIYSGRSNDPITESICPEMKLVLSLVNVRLLLVSHHRLHLASPSAMSNVGYLRQGFSRSQRLKLCRHNVSRPSLFRAAVNFT